MDEDVNYIDRLRDKLQKNKVNEKKAQRYITYAENLINQRLPVIFNNKHLSILLGIKPEILGNYLANEDYSYSEVKIPKKNGTHRLLSIPSKNLKIIQRWILDNILISIRISDYATGFCRNRSILTNAKSHLNQECLINTDIKDFFPSIHLGRIFKVFYNCGYTKKVSYTLAKICTYHGALPQGSPASPYLSNIVCNDLDNRIHYLAKSYEATYTRYADDISISGKNGIQNCIMVVKKIICEEGFQVNNEKTRISFRYQKQVVNGLIVNGVSVAIDKKYLKKFAQELYYIKKFGILDHQKRLEMNKAFYKEHLYGKAYFIKMIDFNKGISFIKILDEICWEY